MESHYENKCHAIIHSHAAAAAAGNIVPVPGLGIAVDITTMTTMTMVLAAGFGADITTEVAKNMAISSMKNVILKNPIKFWGKFIPLVNAGISVAMLESAGWATAKKLYREYG